ncbi:MAG: molybdate ABC transporter substrate-binding protein [Chloroflexi bacterium]|nr:molybdate ABC transporter substrate-binding protein [Chloroflexota bacterium]
MFRFPNPTRATASVLLAGVALTMSACGSPQTPTAAPTAVPATATRPEAPPTAAPTPIVAKEVTVFAAASLTDVFKEIGASFEKDTPAAKITFNFGASNTLRTQLEQGAKADVFASANQAEMTKAAESKVVTATPVIFAKNRLTIIVPKDNPRKVMEMKDLGRKGLKFITTDKGVPIGQYTLDMLDKAAKDAAFGPTFKDAVMANVVSNEADVRQLVSKVALGEADAGVSYSTDVNSSMAPKIATIEVPDAFNTLATYPIATVASGAQVELGAKFVDYVAGAGGQAILKKYGFAPPK